MTNSPKPEKYPEITVRIGESQRRDSGKGYARLDPKIQAELDLHAGDGLLLQNPKTGKKSVALVMYGYPEDENSGIVRIDGALRRNLKASIDERITIQKVDVVPAKSIQLVSIEKRVGISNPNVFRRYLDNRLMIEGDILGFDVYGGSLFFVVKKTDPSGVAVQVTRSTDFSLERMPVEPSELERVVPRTNYEDLGGIGDVIQKTREMVELPMRHPELFARLGIQPPKGLLLYGPPGTGKTMLARAVANETDAHFITMSGPEIMSKFYGQSEENLRKVFKEAQEKAPAIIFIDEIDSIAPKREETQGEVERRVVAQLLSLMDGLDSRGNVVVIGATNRPNALDPALRRPGRFDREVEIGVPSMKGRHEILQIHTRGMPLTADVDLEEISKHTHGFVGADIAALAKEAGMISLRRVLPELNLDESVIPPEILQRLNITQDDFLQAATTIEPSALREVMITTPTETWEDIGGLSEAKRALREAVEWPLLYPNIYKELKAKPSKGILLFGLPGTGKTLLAKALAHESQANFISVKGPEFFSKWVGDSEKAVRETFRKARQSSPAIIFMDEIDAIAPNRTNSGNSNQVSERMVSQLLTELDGLERLNNVILVAATNRPDIIDPALMRAGRFGKQIHIGLPDIETRKAIFEIHLRDLPLSSKVNIDELARLTEGKSGADIEAICSEAVQNVIRRFVESEGMNDLSDSNKEHMDRVTITPEDFRSAFDLVLPQVERSKSAYQKMSGAIREDLYS